MNGASAEENVACVLHLTEVENPGLIEGARVSPTISSLN